MVSTKQDCADIKKRVVVAQKQAALSFDVSIKSRLEQDKKPRKKSGRIKRSKSLSTNSIKPKMQIKDAGHLDKIVMCRQKRIKVKHMTRRRFDRWCDRHLQNENLRRIVLEEEDEQDSWAAVS